jgi:hypothetical protein
MLNDDLCEGTLRLAAIADPVIVGAPASVWQVDRSSSERPRRGGLSSGTTCSAPTTRCCARGSWSPTGSIDYWLAYVDACRELAAEAGASMRVLDKAFWQHSRDRSAGMRA